MILPVRNGTITAQFDQPRPLLTTSKTHIHGALDIVGPTRASPVISPIRGKAHFAQFLRQSISQEFYETDKPAILNHPAHNYFYDLYGGLCLIEDFATGNLHIMTHFWGSSLWKMGNPTYIESSVPGRFPLVALIGHPFDVDIGTPLLPIGNAGYSTGPHLHWEIHPDARGAPYSYAERIDPFSLLEPK